jgi:hypothetical protein
VGRPPVAHRSDLPEIRLGMLNLMQRMRLARYASPARTDGALAIANFNRSFSAKRQNEHARPRALPGDELPGRFLPRFYGDTLGAAEGDGATLAVTSEGFAVAAGEIFAAGLAAALDVVVAAGEPETGPGEAVAVAAGVGIPINSLCNALSLELC